MAGRSDLVAQAQRAPSAAAEPASSSVASQTTWWRRRFGFLAGGDDDEVSLWLYATFFLLTMAQALPLTAINVLLNRDLDLQSRPEVVNRYFAVEFSMSMLKPVYAALSDLCPIAGRRRVPYMIIGGVGYALVLQWYARVTSVGTLYAAGISSSIFYSLCETGADGLLVQMNTGRCPKRAVKLQATGMLVRSCGSFLATLISIPLLTGISARDLISLAGVLSLAAAAAACLIFEPPLEQTATGVGCGGFDALPLPGWFAERCLSCREAVERGLTNAWRTASALKPCFTRQMVCAATFLFAYRITPTAMVTYTSFTYAQFSLPNWAYSGLLLISMSAGILTTWLYRQVSWQLSMTHVFIVGAVVNAACNLIGRLPVVYSWDGSEEKTDAPVAALVSSNFFSSFGLMFGFMPILALAAQSSPQGLEAFGYSMLLFTADLGTSCGSVLAAELTKGLGLGAGPDRSWSNLVAFIWLCALFKFVPLVMLPLIRVAEEPDGGTGGNALGRGYEGECSDSGGIVRGEGGEMGVEANGHADDNVRLLSVMTSSDAEHKYLMSDASHSSSRI